MATSLPTYVGALDRTWGDLASVVSDAGDAAWDAPTELPGWTVKDVVAHVAGVEALLLGEPYPDAVVPDFAHVRNDAGRWVEGPVHARRPLSGPDVLAELRDVTGRRLAALRALDDAALDDTVSGLMGRPMVLKHLLGIRVFDSWAHEQDVRRALGRPGGLDSPGAEVSRRRMLLAFVGLPVAAGRSVAFVTTEPDSAATVTFGSSYAEGADDGADARIACDFDTFVRLGTGRVAPADAVVTVSGDTALADQVLREMAITP
jgi:uncharacterized protein (TIGR03083 family)